MAQKFIANHGESEKTVKVDPRGGGRYVVKIDGVDHEVDARRFAAGTWSLLIDNQSYDVELEVATPSEGDGAYNALVRGKVVKLTVRDERHVRMGLTSQKFKLEGPQIISAPMPGKIVKILVAVGQDVEEAAPVLIMEAMKMENELRTPKSGKVSALLVKEGQTVEAHTKLMTVD